jgi:Flp pilus assembly protein TadG
MMRPASFLAEDHGGALIESAASLTAMLMIFFGIMDCSRALYAALYVGYAARAAARYAMVRGSTWSGKSCSSTATASCMATSANVTSFVQGIAPLGVNTGTNLTINTTWPGTDVTGAACIATNGNNSPGCVAQVKVTYNFHFVLPFLPSNTVKLVSSSAVTIAQ